MGARFLSDRGAGRFYEEAADTEQGLPYSANKAKLSQPLIFHAWELGIGFIFLNSYILMVV